MSELVYTCLIMGNPTTKKNSIRVAKNHNGQPRIIQSDTYYRYRKAFLSQVPRLVIPIDYPVKVEIIYYRKTKKIVDLLNLMACTHDLLVEAKVLKDDNYKIIQSVDGSRIEFDRDNPRIKINIYAMEAENEKICVV